MRPTNIFLVRHAESVGNVDRKVYDRIQDHLIPLTDKGHEQALLCGAELTKLMTTGHVAIYCSPFLRTRQTLQGIMKGLQNSRHVSFIHEDPRLREQEWGYKHSYQLPRSSFLDEQKRRIEYSPFYYRLPHGENGADVYDRVSTFLETLHRDFNKPDFPDNVLIITHGLTLRIFLMRWFHWSVEYFDNLKNPLNASIYHLQRETDHSKYKLLTPMSLYDASITDEKLCQL